MRGILTVLLLLLLPLGAAAQLPDGLAGRWAGTLVEAGREVAVAVSLAGTRGGFEVTITATGAAPLRASLVRSSKPGVFEVAAAGGLFRFFDGSGGRSPLDGEPLVWARQTAQGLVTHRLQIAADGGSILERYALAPTPDGLELQLERRVDGSALPPSRVTLRQGG